MNPTPEIRPGPPPRSVWVFAVVAAAGFHLAYTWRDWPWLGLALVIFIYGLARPSQFLSAQNAFRFGVVVGLLAYAPQAVFFYHIFGVAAVVLWLVLAIWPGVFVLLGQRYTTYWGWEKACLLMPFLWTGLEYFRSELYPLKFSWLNLGYAFAELPAEGLLRNGMYGSGFLVASLAAGLLVGPQLLRSENPRAWIGLAALSVGVLSISSLRPHPAVTAASPVQLVGLQLEFPSEAQVRTQLDEALIRFPEANLFVLSEYTFDGPVPGFVRDWCRKHAKYLVAGGKSAAPTPQYYNTAFVVSPTGEVVFEQAKCVPIQFFQDGLPAPQQRVWESPWGRIGICICYDLSYTRVTDALVAQGAQLLLVPTMDVEEWGRQEHELHARVAPTRAAEYGIPIFRLASSGISQAVTGTGKVVSHTSTPGPGEWLEVRWTLPGGGTRPWDRWFAPACSVLTGVLAVAFGAHALAARTGISLLPSLAGAESTGRSPRSR